MTRIWAGSGIVFIVLFSIGLFFADVLASPSYPAIEESTATIRGYFAENAGEVRALAFFHALAALTLLLFAAHLFAVLREAGATGSLPALALTGGALSSAFLLLSVLPMWTLARTGSAADASVVRTLHDLSYLAGGTAFLLAAAVLVGAASLAAAPRRLLPRWAGRLGLVGAALAVASTTALLFETFGPPFLIALLAMLILLLWIFATSVVLVLRVRRMPVRSAGSAEVTAGATGPA